MDNPPASAPLLLLLLPWLRVDLVFLCLATDAFRPQPRAAVLRPQARPDPTRVRKIVPPALPHSHRSHTCERCGKQGGFLRYFSTSAKRSYSTQILYTSLNEPE